MGRTVLDKKAIYIGPMTSVAVRGSTGPKRRFELVNSALSGLLDLENPHDVPSGENIPAYIFKLIEDAILVVADLTGNNGNVLYELAVANFCKTPTLLIIEDGHPPPFYQQHTKIISVVGKKTASSNVDNQKIKNELATSEIRAAAERYLRGEEATTLPYHFSASSLATSVLSEQSGGYNPQPDTTAKKYELIKLGKSFDHHGGYSGQTIFGHRMRHFSEEKQFLAEIFTPLLLARCRAIIEREGCRLCLMIDAGTTLYPMFELIGRYLIRWKEQWQQNLSIVTNNLPGLETFMEAGRRGKDRRAELIVPCSLLPGDPLPAYWAVTGANTEAAIVRLKWPEWKLPSNSGDDAVCYLHNSDIRKALLRRKNDLASANLTEGTKKCVHIALITGNWIRVDPETPTVARPLARGYGHLRVKQAYLDVADEAYVVSPLGKIFADKPLDKINSILENAEREYTNRRGNQTKHVFEKYDELMLDQMNSKYLKLVTTRRDPKGGHLLSPLSTHLFAEMQLHVPELWDKSFIDANVGEALQIAPNFNPVSAIEMPHEYTRESQKFRELLTEVGPIP